MRERRSYSLSRFAGVVVLALSSSLAAADGNDPLRQLIGQQVGGIDKLKVPATNAEIPVAPPPTADSGLSADRYVTTEAKRYLGKLLFHDPVRTARVNKGNADDPKNPQPLPLPAGTAFGGTVTVATAQDQAAVDAVVAATRQTGSCGSCHIGEAAGKAGQQLNFNVGGEGRGYTDEHGNFIPRRRTQSILTQQRDKPIFPGDTLVDALPTLTDIYTISGERTVTTPAAFYHTPTPTAMLETGRLDELDSVGRESPAVVGFAFNNRLLLGGFAGEPQSTPGSLNPHSDPAQENLTLLLLDAHRMINFQAAELQKNPAFVELFKQAFPTEYATYQKSGSLDDLVSDDTVLRATATFLRTVVTRNTPFDRFLGGDDRALTAAQKRGAQLFFTRATDGGAGCFTCHSGPMLNKQVDDPDVTGTGHYVDENFFNVGIGDHPVQALNALARGHLDWNDLGADGFPYHAEDTGRQEITKNPDDAFKFRVLTLRQLNGAGTFFHNGSFSKVRDVVEYFNSGVPQDRTAGSAATLSPRFTNPRGQGYPAGLGLSSGQVDDLADFLENGLYDPALVHYDPASTTDTLQPNERDLAYSKYHPELVAACTKAALPCAKDGFLLSGLAIDSNDPLTRRDEGLEFLDVSGQIKATLVASRPVQDGDDPGPKDSDDRSDRYSITNSGKTVVDTHLLIVVQGLPKKARLTNANGFTIDGDPYIRVYLPDGVLQPGQSIARTLEFESESHFASLSYSLKFLSGQGKP